MPCKAKDVTFEDDRQASSEQGKLRLGIRACCSNSGADSSLTFPHYIANSDPQHFIYGGRALLFYNAWQNESIPDLLTIYLTTLCVLMQNLHVVVTTMVGV